jgi:hypothetical protein
MQQLALMAQEHEQVRREMVYTWTGSLGYNTGRRRGVGWDQKWRWVAVCGGRGVVVMVSRMLHDTRRVR